MTEEEWLACDDCRKIWEVLKSKKSKRTTHRTMRFYLAAFWGWQALRLTPKETQQVLDQAAVAERWAETGTRPKEAKTNRIIHYLNAKMAITKTTRAPYGWKKPEAIAIQVTLLHCIFGNPFHPITLSPSWLTSTVVSLANQMYDSRDFSAMPILADALMDASCDNEEILTHCRGPGPHVRGCFVIDLLTKRE
jgi:hypothetical protein